MAPASGIVILAHRLALLRFHRDRPQAALGDLHVAALIPCLQLPVEPKFYACPLATHPWLRLRAQDLIAAAGEREGVVVTDDTLFYMTENGSQIQLLSQRSMMI